MPNRALWAASENRASKQILYLSHAISQTNAPGRMIWTREVRAVPLRRVVIEGYPEDARGHSCWILGRGEDNHPLHVACALKTEYLAVITTYLSSPEQWEPDSRTRRKM